MSWYRTGTASIANGATAVTGVLTAWAANAKAEDAISFDGGDKWYEIASVNSNTSITLASAFGETTVSGGAYVIERRGRRWSLTSELNATLTALLASVTHILAGSGAPSDELGANGDVYFDTVGLDFYGPKAGGEWPAAVSLNGIDGADGNTILSGSGAPSNGSGANGDYYIDVAAKMIYGPKAAGSWPAGVALNGTNGTNGNTVLYGTAAPTTEGVNGDFYIRTTTNYIYGPKAAGSWPAGVPLNGTNGSPVDWEGAWQTATAYQVLDAVSNGGRSYICTSGHTSGASTEPGVGGSWATVWDLMADKGADGIGTGDVTAASSFGTDNRLIRSDGTGKGVQASGITVDDSDNVSGVNSLAIGSDPSGANDAVRLSYLQTVLQGLKPKGSVRARTTANVNLAGGGLANGTTHDGVTVATGEIVLVGSQSTAAENGLYVVPASGAASRSSLADTWAEIVGATVIVEEGTTYADTGWLCTGNAGGTLGSSAITWVQWFGSGQFQTANALLTAIAALSMVADRLIYGTGSGTVDLATLTAAGRALIDDATAQAQRTTLGFTGTFSDLASAGTTDLSSIASIAVNITGTTTITSFGSGADLFKLVKFAGALTLTHNGTSLILPSSLNITTVAGDCAIFVSDGSSNWRCVHYMRATGASRRVDETLVIACSDETTAITTGTAKVTFRMPFAMTLTAVRASLSTVSSSGNPAIDINEGGASIFSTTLTIDANEKTSTTAATAAVLSDTALADDAEITIDIDTAGTGAKGLKVYLIGYRNN